MKANERVMVDENDENRSNRRVSIIKVYPRASVFSIDVCTAMCQPSTVVRVNVNVGIMGPAESRLASVNG